MSAHRVVLIGSGFGGLFGAKALARKDVEVTLVSRSTSHLFQPLLYQVATSILSSGEIAPATRDVLRRQRNATTVLGEVTGIDLAARTVTATSQDRSYTLDYDSLIVAAGAGQSYFGNDRFAQFAPGMKTIDDALELRARILGAFEQAELAALRGDGQEAARQMSFVVVGAGPTGVEMAGQIAELSRRTLKRNFRAIDPSQARIVLLDAADQVLGSFGERLGDIATRRLTKIGVEVELGAKVIDVTRDAIVVEDRDGDTRRIDSICKVWAAGVAASPLARTLAEQVGEQVDRAGRIPVRPDLTLPGHPEVYVVGDMIALDHLPGVAQVAIQGARHAAKDITARVAGRPGPGDFHYRDKGSMATISRFSAVASIGRLQFGGFIAWLMWLALHLVYIIGFKSQITALLHWVVSFLGSGRSERALPRL